MDVVLLYGSYIPFLSSSSPRRLRIPHRLSIIIKLCPLVERTAFLSWGRASISHPHVPSPGHPLSLYAPQHRGYPASASWCIRWAQRLSVPAIGDVDAAVPG